MRGVISRPVAEAEFAVTYEGPALAEGRMPVADLAPSLLALGQLFTEASRVAFPEREPASLNIKAQPERGSFLVQLAVQSPGAWDEIRDLLSGASITALLNLQGLVFGEGGLMWLLKALKGQLGVSKERLPSGGFRFKLPDGAVYESSAEAGQLYDRPSARRAARRVVAPLQREGVDRVEFTRSDEPPLELEKQDVPAFEPQDELEGSEVLEREDEAILAVITPSFEGDYKWRFSEGESILTARMEDPAFRARIDAGERFAQGDSMRVRMRVVQTVTPGGKPTIERTITQVIQHFPRAEQTSIEIDDNA